MENFVEIKVRTTPKHRDIVKNHAASMGESTTSFVVRAINETMERDNRKEMHAMSNREFAKSL